MPADADTAARMAAAFAATLRRMGVPVVTGNVVAFVEALGRVGLEDRAPVYWAGRATLVQRPELHPRYDQAFATFWLQREPIRTSAEAEPVVLALDEDVADDDGVDGSAEDRDARTIAVRYCPTEVLRHKDFAAYTPEEFREARRLMADLRLGGALRRTHRLRRAHHRTRHPDLRRTVHRSLRLHGEPIDRAFLEPGERARRVVLLCDVSGSMETYSRALLRFLHAAIVSRGRGKVEAFALGTRLTRLTRELTSHDPDAALAAAARAVEDWSGGTRLGEAIKTFNDEWGVRGLARGAVVVILSDGWDRGDAAELGRQMARLHRVAHKVVWVNPLKSSPGYAPLAAGMAAALPHVDEFVEGHSLAALATLAEVVAAP